MAALRSHWKTMNVPNEASALDAKECNESQVRDDRAKPCLRGTGSFRIRRKPEGTHDR
jgi:hypothetical protein